MNWQLWPFASAACGASDWRCVNSPPQGSTSRPADLPCSDGTTPTCAGLPPQPHPKRLIKRDTVSTWTVRKGSRWPMLRTLAARQRTTQIGLLSTTLGGRWRGGLWFSLHFLAGNWSFGDTADSDVSCRGLISLAVFTISTDGCLSSARNGACMSLPAEVDLSRWVNVRAEITVISLIKLYCSMYPDIKVTFVWLHWFIQTLLCNFTAKHTCMFDFLEHLRLPLSLDVWFLLPTFMPNLITWENVGIICCNSLLCFKLLSDLLLDRKQCSNFPSEYGAITLKLILKVKGMMPIAPNLHYKHYFM